MSPNGKSALHAFAVVLVAAGVLFGCSEKDQGTNADINAAAPSAPETEDDTATGLPDGSTPVFHAEGNPDALSAWGQLSAQDGELLWHDGVTPYALVSPLFSDYALKLRTVWLPDGAEPAGYQGEEVFDFPVGTVITKTFYYELVEGEAGADLRVVKTAASTGDFARPLDLDGVRLVETRVLAHRESGWVALPYVWNDEQTDAMLQRVGDLVPMTLVDGGEETPFPYVVPNANQCAGCHATNHTTKEILPIGPKARHLNTSVDLGDDRGSQLDLWSAMGLVDGLPNREEIPQATIWDDDTLPIDDRARAYLDINCAHCHNRNGPADTSGLFLEPSTEVGPRLGVCKPPVAAGTGTGNRRVGIHPGEPDDSIFVFRMETDDPGAMMPELGRALTHREGVDLISQWIDSLDGGCNS